MIVFEFFLSKVYNKVILNANEYVTQILVLILNASIYYNEISIILTQVSCPLVGDALLCFNVTRVM